MSSHRYVVILCILVGSVLLMGGAAQAVMDPASSDGPGAAPLISPRLIVELKQPPLAVRNSSEIRSAAFSQKLEINTADAQAYIAQLQAEQAAFVGAMQAAVPGASVATYINEIGAAEQATYQVVFNGVAVDAGPMGREAVRVRLLRLPQVKAVYDDRAYQTQLYTSTNLINAPLVWNNPAIGGVQRAGDGVKIASLDGGLHKDAPMLSGSGYSYPSGYAPNGLGLAANNNGKIIVSRTYFRPWDPPPPGNANPWPGDTDTPHGNHTGSIAGGNCVDNVVYTGFRVGSMCGVAPRAYLMSYKLFYTSVNGIVSSYTVETLAALEDMVKDGADVVNNSWGEGPISEGGPYDPVDTALLNAARAGVFVAISAGNLGPGLGTTDHPSDGYVSVAASTTTGTLVVGRLSVKEQPDLQDMPYAQSLFGAPIANGQIVEYDYLPSGVIDADNILGCKPWLPGTFAGKAALILRGECEFSVKVLNAELGGAEFVVVYNHATGGDELVTMAPGAGADLVTISSLFVGNTDGLALVQNYIDNGPAAARLIVDTVPYQLGNVADRIPSFSSRGPGVGNMLKPDIAAPGVNILAQGYAEGVSGEARHLGYGQVSGTSMAAPHVAGAAALLRQIYPGWSNATIKSALMSTAKYLDVYNFDETPAQPLDMGAGRLDVAAAVDPGVILDPPSLSFGPVFTGTAATISVTVRSMASVPETYAVTTLYTGDGFTQTTSLPGFSVTPNSMTLAPGASAMLAVSFNPADSQGYGDNQGFVVMQGNNGHAAHLPVWARVTYAQPLADVLVIDNDASELGSVDYAWYYTHTLDALGITYNVIGTLVEGIPDATQLAAYGAVILFSGDNYLATVSQNEHDRLVEYLNGGGRLFVAGQDMAASLSAAAVNPPAGSRNFLYTYRLGANYIQDSVSGGVTPNQFIVPTVGAPAALNGVRVDLTQPHLFMAGGSLSGDAEAPPVATETTGEFSLLYNVDRNLLTFEVTVVPTATEPITVTDAYIHHGPPGEVGPALRSLDTEGLLPAIVTETLTLRGVLGNWSSTDVAQLLNGEFYINIQTTRYPSGEIRGTVEPAALPNQAYVDEIDNVFHDGSQEPNPGGGTSESNLASHLILRYAGPNNIYDGAVAAAHRDQVSLERPGTDYAGRSIYATFGLEGMNESFNPTLGYTPTARSTLLSGFLLWLYSEPGTATISDTTPLSTTGTMLLSASWTPPAGITELPGILAGVPSDFLYPVSYRWDFGDGSPYVSSASASAGHRYVCTKNPADNVHSVRVEVRDSLGNVTLGSHAIDAAASCYEGAAIVHDVFMPSIWKSR